MTTPETKPALKLNDALDAKALKKAFKNNERILIQNIMDEKAAEATHTSLRTDIKWDLFFLNGGQATVITDHELNTMTNRRIKEMYSSIYTYAREHYQTMSYTFGLEVAHENNILPDLYLHKVHDFLNSEDVLKMVGDITGEKLVKTDMVAHWHKHDHFRTSFSNFDGMGKRKIAFSLDLSKNWSPDWGGFLQYYDEEENIVEGYKPTFNSLTLHKDPQKTSISYVTAFALQPRLTISGWFWVE